LLQRIAAALRITAAATPRIVSRKTAIVGAHRMPSNHRLETAIDRIKFARQYTKRFLARLSDAEWFWCPSELTTHIAWQVGHVAVSQYNLCLRRMRGRTTADESLIPDQFIEVFKLGSAPDPNPANNPSLAEIRQVFDAVEQQVVTELSTRNDTELDIPVEQPHPVFKTKLQAVEYAPLHELVHAGHIALLRRMMGRPPLR
jgi:hypothetical protein